MNVNADAATTWGAPAPHAASVSAGTAGSDFARRKEAEPTFSDDDRDSVHISLEARARMKAAAEASALLDNPLASLKESRKAEALSKYTAEDLAPLKKRFAALIDLERGIHGRLDSLMDKKGISLGPHDQIKIEIDSQGRAIVGGVRDVSTARAIEKAINSDKKFLKEIVDFQKEEKALSNDLREATGVSLKEFGARIDAVQRAPEGFTPVGYTREEAVGLMDQDIYLVDEEFAGMIGEHYAMKSALVDFSGENNILEDAEGTVNRTMTKVIGDIANAFREMNKKTRMESGDYPDPLEYLENSLLSINRLKISVNNDGQVAIEGTACKDNSELDRWAKDVVNSMFEEELKVNPATGKQHDFMTASSYLLNIYDESFGEGNALGLGEADRTLEAVFDHGKIESHVSSPERERELAVAIDETAKAALSDMGIDATDITIEMNDDGKLAATNLSPEHPKFESIQMALDLLNAQTETRSIEDAHKKDLAVNPVQRLKGLMTNMDILRPGGASFLKRTEAAREDTERKAADAEQAA